MPIFHIEMNEEPAPNLARSLADALGSLMGSEAGHTWVRVVACDAALYAENQVTTPPRTIFVRLILRALPDEEGLAEQARAITQLVAKATGRREDDVHVYFDPPAAGRIAFGGELVRDKK